jgi:predicted GIY-YIG superfamily endonuclease
MTGQFIRSEGDRNIIKVYNWQEVALHVDHRTRKEVKSTALKHETAIKYRSRSEKLALIAT